MRTAKATRRRPLSGFIAQIVAWKEIKLQLCPPAHPEMEVEDSAAYLGFGPVEYKLCLFGLYLQSKASTKKRSKKLPLTRLA